MAEPRVWFDPPFADLFLVTLEVDGRISRGYYRREENGDMTLVALDPENPPPDTSSWSDYAGQPPPPQGRFRRWLGL